MQIGSLVCINMPAVSYLGSTMFVSWTSLLLGAGGVSHLQTHKLCHGQWLATAGLASDSRMPSIVCISCRHCPEALPVNRVWGQDYGPFTWVAFLGILPQGQWECKSEEVFARRGVAMYLHVEHRTGSRVPGRPQGAGWGWMKSGLAPRMTDIPPSSCSSQHWVLNTRVRWRNTHPRKASPWACLVP